MLIKYKANIYIKNIKGCTPMNVEFYYNRVIHRDHHYQDVINVLVDERNNKQKSKYLWTSTKWTLMNVNKTNPLKRDM